jgi:hypothetical protein
VQDAHLAAGGQLPEQEVAGQQAGQLALGGGVGAAVAVR